MKRSIWTRVLAFAIALLLVGSVAAATLNFDLNGDGKTNVWDLQLAINGGKSQEEQTAALKEAMGGKGDELHKNAEGQWEIWSVTGLYNMAKLAEAGDTFVLMQDIDMGGALWTPVENFKGTLIGNQHQVSNMKITRSVNGNMGFFASIAEGSTIVRLNLAGINLNADADTVAIGIVAGTCSGKIDACTAIGFLSDYRTALPADLKVGGMVGKLTDSGEIVTHVENMLHAEGQDSEIPNISVKFAMRTAPETAAFYAELVDIVGESKGTLDPMALLEDVNGILPDPNAIAWVKNGDVQSFPLTVEELLQTVNADGNTVITLQSDITYNDSIHVPYSSTWDLNGHTIRTNPNTGYGLHFIATGSDNKVATVKNGTIYHYGVGIRVAAGGVIVTNMKLHGTNAPCVGIYDPSPDYNEINLIEDCELYHSIWGVFTYNGANTDYSNVNITVNRSKLVAYAPSGSALFVKRSSNDGTVGGTVTLGYDVEMYTYGNSVTSGNTLAGVDPVKLEDPANVEIDGVVHEGMKHWTTNESVIATEVIAEITNGNNTVQVTNTKDLADAVSSTGNTKIKLLKDITCTAQLTLPYSCTVDLNNFSITNNSSTALRFAAAGTENTVAYVKNGTVNHYVHGIRLETGSLNVSNVRFNSLNNSSTICFIDTNGAYRANNQIDNCYIYNPKGLCINWNVAGADFSNTGVTLTNTTLISPSGYVFGVASNATSGIIDLGEHVQMYGKNSKLAPDRYRYCGMMAGKTDNVSVTVKDTNTAHTLNWWSTDNQKETINILLLGNSLSTTIPEELYEIAKRDGIQLNVTDLYHSGAYGWQHKEWITNNSNAYEYRVYNDMGFWFHGDIKSVPEAVDYLEWDHVSYQEWFTAGYAKTYEQAVEQYEASVAWVIDYLKTEIPNAKFYFYEHWSWQVGHSTVPDVATQTALFEAIRDASHYFAEKYEATLIPCGEAWQLARANPLIGDTLCKADNLHDEGSTGGQYLNGCVFYEVMFQRTCIGDTWRASNGPSEEKHQALQQHAHDAVAAIYGESYAK